ncbi:MAG: hypothetical protein FJ308_12020 [Planctomycetes bacterium]|nr:hypothetical protein [Planctomycetota bacterium]
MNFQVHCPVCSGEFDVEDPLDQDHSRTSQHQCPSCGALIRAEDSVRAQLELQIDGFQAPAHNPEDLLELEEPSTGDNSTSLEPKPSLLDLQSGFLQSGLSVDELSVDDNIADNHPDLCSVTDDLRVDGGTPDADLPVNESSVYDHMVTASVAEPPAMAWNQIASRPRPQPKQQSALRKLIPPVLGGLTAIPIAIGILWYGFGRDLGNAGPTVARYVPWIVPKHLRGRSVGYTHRWDENGTTQKPATQEKKPNLDAGAFGKIGGGRSDLQKPESKTAFKGNGVFGGVGGGSNSTNADHEDTTPYQTSETAPDSLNLTESSKAPPEQSSSMKENLAMDIVEDASPMEDPERPIEMVEKDATIHDDPSMEPVPSPINVSLLPSTAVDNEQEMRIKPDDDLIPADFGGSSSEVTPVDVTPVDITPEESMPASGADAGVDQGVEETLLVAPNAAMIEAEADKLIENLFASLNDVSIENNASRGDDFCNQLTGLAIGLDAVAGTPFEDRIRDRVSALATRVLDSKPIRTAIEEHSLNRISRVPPPGIGEISVWIADKLTPIGAEPHETDRESLAVESSPSLMLQARVASLILDRKRTHAVERFSANESSTPSTSVEHLTVPTSKLVFGKLLQWDDTACVVEIIAILP